MLTTTGFAPYNQPDSISKTNLSVHSIHIDYEFSTTTTTFYLAPHANSSFNLTLSNIGALNDSYTITFVSVSGLGINISANRAQLDLGQSTNIEVFINSSDLGRYPIVFQSVDNANIRKELTVQTIVSENGFNLRIDRNEITVKNQRIRIYPHTIGNRKCRNGV